MSKMRVKSKVKFEKDGSTRREAGGALPSASDFHGSKKKTKKAKTQSVLDPVYLAIDDLDETEHEHQIEPGLLTMPSPTKNVSDGSISDLEIPKLHLPLGDFISKCLTDEDDEYLSTRGVHCGVKLTSSKKVSTCGRSDGQQLATTDYTKAAMPSFIPQLLHPINGQVSTFTKHRAYTDFLRNSGFLRLFGECVINVYRMWCWPPPEHLIEQMLNAMGYEIPARKQLIELTKERQTLQHKLKRLTKDQSRLMEKLDEYQDSSAKYELLDQDEILPSRPENTPLNLDLMRAIFKKMTFISDDIRGSRQDPGTDLKLLIPKASPVEYVLPIPYHDKRMLQ